MRLRRLGAAVSLYSVGELLKGVAVRAGADAPVKTTRKSLPQAMSLAEAVSIAGTLGKPSKMPGYSYGLDARKCHRGSVMHLVPGSICYGCYALTDFYLTWRAADRGRERREAGLEHPRWVDSMVRQIDHYCVGESSYFRWHDSGDLHSVEHLSRIVEVCERTPQVKHWLPTREYEMVAEHRRRRGAFPANLTVRLSALMIDAEPPRALPGLEVPEGAIVIPPELWDLPTSTVHTPGAPNPVEGRWSVECRAAEERANKCGPCRSCWSPRAANISYPEH